MDQHKLTVIGPEPAPKKTLKQMTPEERRAYNAQAKARSRERQRQATTTPTANEWRDEFPKQHPAQQKELDEYAAEFAQTVLSELQTDPPHTRYSASYAVDACLDQVARTLHGLKKGWLREVQAPAGELVSGAYFADSLGSIVPDTHRYELERSQTFSAAYRELLRILDKKYGHEQTKDARAIRQELSGEYVLVIPVEPQPVPEPPPAPEPPQLPSSTGKVLAEGRAKLLESLQDQLPPDAFRYLNGENI